MKNSKWKQEDQNKFKKDIDADKSGTDTGSDHTEKRKGVRKFDKPNREVDPDRTGKTNFIEQNEKKFNN